MRASLRRIILLLISCNGMFLNKHEEETLFKRILAKFDLAGEDQRGLYFVDKELASL